MVSSSVLAALRRLQDQGGAVYWPEDQEPPIADINEVIQQKLAKRDNGSGWSAHCGARITNAGREAIGLKPLSLLQRLFR